MTLHDNSTLRVNSTRRRGTAASGHVGPILLDGEPHIRANDAARILVDVGGTSVISAGSVLRDHVKRGAVRAFQVHPRAWLYNEADVLALAERIGSA